MFASLIAGLVEGLGQAVKGNGDIPILAAAGDVVSEAGSRIRGMGAAGSSNEASAQTSESTSFFGSIGNWIRGDSQAQATGSQVAAVSIHEQAPGIPGSRAYNDFFKSRENERADAAAIAANPLAAQFHIPAYLSAQLVSFAPGGPAMSQGQGVSV